MDLTGLESLASLDAGVTGTPLLISLDDIIRDPNQPRQQFDEEPLQELAENIKARGVKSPVSLKSKNADGKYVINHGERRWLASRIAGKTHIPAFIEDDHDGFDQVSENIMRDNLKPVELADWIQARIDNDGMKQADIARRLNKGKDWVSRHVKIASAPKEVREVADRCTDYTALSDLATAFENYPEQTLSFIANAPQIARKDIAQLVARCKNPFSEEERGSGQSSNENTGSQAGASNEDSAAQAPTVPNDGQGKVEDEPGAPAAGSKSTTETKATVTEKEGSASKPQQQNSTPVVRTDANSLLRVIYDAQIVNGNEADGVIDSFSDEEWLKVCRQLTKDHEKGSATELSDFAGALVKGLQSGVYGHTGHALYSMLAFIEGAVFKNNLDPATMRNRCFKVMDSSN